MNVMNGPLGVNIKPMDNMGLNRMKSKYDLEAGKLACRCLIRKWKFCEDMKRLADGKVSKSLLECKSRHELNASGKTLYEKVTKPQDLTNLKDVTKTTQAKPNSTKPQTQDQDKNSTMVKVVSQAKPRLVVRTKRRSKSVKTAPDINQRSILEFLRLINFLIKD